MSPKTAFTEENIVAVRNLITEDRHVTYREIEASLGISGTTIQKILHKALGVRKLVSRWIPHLLSDEHKGARVRWCKKTLQRFSRGESNHVYDIISGDEYWIYAYDPDSKQQSTIWVFQDEPKPTKVVRLLSTSKKMVATFVAKSGHVATIELEYRKTITGEWYTTDCLPKVIADLPKSNPNRRIILHHDNASSHTASRTIEYLKEQNVEILDLLQYSTVPT